MDLERSATGVSIGSYPTFNQADYRTKVTFDGTNLNACMAVQQAFEAAIPSGSLVRSE